MPYWFRACLHCREGRGPWGLLPSLTLPLGAPRSCTETSASPGSQQRRAGTVWQHTRATIPCTTTACSASSPLWEPPHIEMFGCMHQLVWGLSRTPLSRIRTITLSKVMCCLKCAITLLQARVHIHERVRTDVLINMSFTLDLLKPGPHAFKSIPIQ